jgi:hypothetical protein
MTMPRSGRTLASALRNFASSPFWKTPEIIDGCNAVRVWRRYGKFRRLRSSSIAVDHGYGDERASYPPTTHCFYRRSVEGSKGL